MLTSFQRKKFEQLGKVGEEANGCEVRTASLGSIFEGDSA